MTMDKVLRKLFFNLQLTRTHAIQKSCCSSNVFHKDSEPCLESYVSTSADYKKGKKFAVARIKELFNLHHLEAIEIAMRSKKIHKVMNKILSDNYHLLKSYDVEDKIILKYLDLLAEKDIIEKIDLLKQLPFKISDTTPLLLLKYMHLQNLVKKELDEEKRISFFSELLKISVFETSVAFIKRPFLQKLCLKKIEHNLQILLDYEISLEEIRKDFWVLQYNPEIIKERIEMAKERNIVKVKTWMVRSPIEVLDRYCQRRSDNKLILGDATLTEYLSDRLECNLEMAKTILLRHPALSNKHMKKIKDIIDFLLDYGFVPSHIVRNPKILLHSVETTAKRLQQLQSEGLKLDSLYILTKSQKQYLNYYENLVKANKNKVKESA